jgi:hypothetical protein
MVWFGEQMKGEKMWLMEHEGQTYDLGFDCPTLPSMKGRLPNKVMLWIDERNFEHYWEEHATWTSGAGPYAVLAFCRELTITRWQTLDEAIKAKRTIDGSACGGACSRAHIIAHIDPANGFRAAQKAADAKYIAENDIKPMKYNLFA